MLTGLCALLSTVLLRLRFHAACVVKSSHWWPDVGRGAAKLDKQCKRGKRHKYIRSALPTAPEHWLHAVAARVRLSAHDGKLLFAFVLAFGKRPRIALR